MQYQTIILETSDTLDPLTILSAYIPLEFHALLSTSHPDLHQVNLQVRAGIETVRDLSNELSKHAVRGGHKLGIVYSVDSLSSQAQNALLKLLEEPPQLTQLVLITANSSKLLGTILSRSILKRAERTVAKEGDGKNLAQSFLIGGMIEKSRIIDGLLKGESSREAVLQFLQNCLAYTVRESEAFSIPQKLKLSKLLQTAIQNVSASGNLRLTLQTLAISIS